VVPNSMMFRAASALTAVGIVLVLANWYAEPEATLAWAAALAMFAVMIAALRLRRPIAGSTTTTEAMAARGLDQVTTAVVFASLMMGIPLALTLVDSYGLVDDTDIGRRSTGVLIAAFIAMLGNVMPKQLPPLSSTECDGARQQAFYRRMGWTWVLCGLASGIGWLTLPIASAEIATFVVWPAAIVVTVVHLLLLRRPGKSQPANGAPL
jgi:hypothetical protein